MDKNLYFEVGGGIFLALVLIGLIPLVYQFVLWIWNFINDIDMVETDATDKLFPYAEAISLSSADLAWFTTFLIGFVCLFIWPLVLVVLISYIFMLLARTSCRLSKHMKDTKAHGGSSNS